MMNKETTTILSIVMPVYNAQAFLANNIAALIRQEDPALELVLVDDGSTDASGFIAKTLLEKEPEFRHQIITQKNRGVSAARNAGLMAARGDYVFFLDADDRIRDDFVDLFLPVAARQADAILWRCQVLLEGEPLPQQDAIPQWTETQGDELVPEIILQNKGWYTLATTALRREFLMDHGLRFTEGCACGEDQELILKSLSLAGRIEKTDAILAYYFLRADSVMRTCNWRRFDVVAALLRLATHLDGLDKPWARRATQVVQEPWVLSNFFRNLKDCYRQAGAPEPRPWLQELYEQQPELPGIIEPLLKHCPGLDHRLRREVRLFRVAPYLYLKLVGSKI